jgi:hypothetical protein
MTPPMTSAKPQSPNNLQNINNGSFNNSIADYESHEDIIFYGTLVALLIRLGFKIRRIRPNPNKSMTKKPKKCVTFIVDSIE